MMGFVIRGAVRRKQDGDVLSAGEAAEAWRLWLDGLDTADIASLLQVHEAAVYNAVASRRRDIRKVAA